MRKPNKPETADSATKTPSPFSSCKYFNLDFRKYHKVELNKGFICAFMTEGRLPWQKVQANLYSLYGEEEKTEKTGFTEKQTTGWKTGLLYYCIFMNN